MAIGNLDKSFFERVIEEKLTGLCLRENRRRTGDRIHRLIFQGVLLYSGITGGDMRSNKIFSFLLLV